MCASTKIAIHLISADEFSRNGSRIVRWSSHLNQVAQNVTLDRMESTNKSGNAAKDRNTAKPVFARLISALPGKYVEMLKAIELVCKP